MERAKIDLFLMTHERYFPKEKLAEMTHRLEKLDEGKFALVQSVDYKDPSFVFLNSLALGMLGVDRFVIGQTGLGVVKLLTFGGCGIWAFVDFFLIANAAKQLNFEKFASQSV